MTASPRQLPSSASVVVIGGGVIGLSTAFHLAAPGVRDVVLLDERDALGSGSTCKAAGGVRAQFSDPVNIALGRAQPGDLRRLPGAASARRSTSTRSATCSCWTPRSPWPRSRPTSPCRTTSGVPSRMIDVAEARRLSPADRHRAGCSPRRTPRPTGTARPSRSSLGYAAAARRAGAALLPHCAATGIDVVDGRDRRRPDRRRDDPDRRPSCAPPAPGRPRSARGSASTCP